MKHTPGPWQLDSVVTTIKAGDRIVANTEPLQAVFGTGLRECTEEEKVANARLIAAAPEMLETLKQVAKLVSYFPSTDQGIEAIGSLHTAITKATGAKA